ncbi:MAG: thiamine pyrophosphate-binding protein [Sedimenticola sp.]
MNKSGKKHTTISGAFLDFFDGYGIDKIFLIPGAHITPIMRELEHHKKITPVIAAHELGAAYMAIGYSRATGKPGVVLSIGGPGAAYMMAAAVVAKADNVPVVFITGDIPARHHGFGEFQDSGPSGTNDSEIYREAIGESHICHFQEDIPRIMDRIHIRYSSKLPIHIQLPYDVQGKEFDGQVPTAVNFRFSANKNTALPVDTSIRTVLFIGLHALGIIDSSKLNKFVRMNRLGVVTDLKARGIYSEDLPECFGFVGFNSDPRALEVLNISSELSAETVISIGVKQEVLRQYVNPEVEVINISPDDFSTILGDGNAILYDSMTRDLRSRWIDSVASNKISIAGGDKVDELINYQFLINLLQEKLPVDTCYCLDAGQVRHAGSILVTCKEERTLIQSDSLSPMGHGICASIGVKVANPCRPVVSLFGDGSMRMHGIEIATAVKYKLPIIFILLDNRSYASILSRGGMENYSNLAETDWNSFAQAFGMACLKVKSCADFDSALSYCIGNNEPVLLWVSIGGLPDNELKLRSNMEYKSWITKINNIQADE